MHAAVFLLCFFCSSSEFMGFSVVDNYCYSRLVVILNPFRSVVHCVGWHNFPWLDSVISDEAGYGALLFNVCCVVNWCFSKNCVQIFPFSNVFISFLFYFSIAFGSGYCCQSAAKGLMYRGEWYTSARRFVRRPFEYADFESFAAALATTQWWRV